MNRYVNTEQELEALRNACIEFGRQQMRSQLKADFGPVAAALRECTKRRVTAGLMTHFARVTTYADGQTRIVAIEEIPK